MAFDQIKLENFLSALAIDHGHLGLVVTDGEVGTVALPLIKNGLASIDLDAQTDPDAVLSLLLDCAKRSRWCRLNLVDGSLPGRVYNQLRNLSVTGHLDVAQIGAKGMGQEVRWPAEAKVVLVANSAILEQISVPTFLNLFGPVLR